MPSKNAIRRRLFWLATVILMMASTTLYLDGSDDENALWHAAHRFFGDWTTAIVYGAFWTSLSAALFIAEKPWQKVALLAIMLGTTTFQMDIAYVLSAFVPMILSRTASLRWFSFQLAFFVVPILVLFAWIPDLDSTTTWPTLSAALGAHTGWQILSFSLGWMVERVQEARAVLAERNEELRDAQRQLARQTRLAERLTLSRELHDTVGHHIAALGINLELAQQLSTNPQAKSAIRDAQRGSHELLSEIRDVVRRLRAPVPIALGDALQAFAKGAPITVNLDLRADIAQGPSPHVLYRCAQEATTNAMVHGEATEITIAIKQQSDGVSMHIRDNAQGAEEYELGNGLLGMKERVASVGGRVELLGGPGFPLHIWVPLADDPPWSPNESFDD